MMNLFKAFFNRATKKALTMASPRNFGRPINHITIHCTASSVNAKVSDIKKYWKNTLRWKSVGYHYIIGRKGERHILASLSSVVNGVRGHNWDGVHISYIGGKGGKDNRTEAQKEEMFRLLEELTAPDLLGNVQVLGHRDWSPDLNGDGKISPNEYIKLCPSFDVGKWYKNK